MNQNNKKTVRDILCIIMMLSFIATFILAFIVAFAHKFGLLCISSCGIYVFIAGVVLPYMDKMDKIELQKRNREYFLKKQKEREYLKKLHPHESL